LKAIQITFDESLLEQLDDDEEVRKRGRSAVLRQLVREFLDQKRAAAIDAQYRRGYANFAGLGPEFEGWEKMGAGSAGR
jgi:metal-responsive CopG/Arc/MetJ family transcriptional regulator